MVTQVLAQRKSQTQPPLAANPTEIRLWLEWAGAKLLSYRISSPAPKAYKVAWPEFPNESTAYGYTGETLRAAAPHPREIKVMDEILALPSLVSNTHIRRILHSRALVAPVSGRYLFSYKKIAVLLHADARLVARMHGKGLAEIAAKIPPAQAYIIRSFLAPPNTAP